MTEATLAPTAPARSVPLVSRLRVRAAPYALISPKLAFFGLFLAFPIGWAIYLSFESGSILGTLHYVGLRNYQRLIHDSIFWLSLENTLIYAVIVIPFAIVGGLVLAALLNRPIRLRGVFRAAL